MPPTTVPNAYIPKLPDHHPKTHPNPVRAPALLQPPPPTASPARSAAGSFTSTPSCAIHCLLRPRRRLSSTMSFLVTIAPSIYGTFPRSLHGDVSSKPITRSKSASDLGFYFIVEHDPTCVKVLLLHHNYVETHYFSSHILLRFGTTIYMKVHTDSKMLFNLEGYIDRTSRTGPKVDQLLSSSASGNNTLLLITGY